MRWHEKELVLAKQRAQKEQDARVLLKHLASLKWRSLTAHLHLDTSPTHVDTEDPGSECGEGTPLQAGTQC